MRSKLLKAGVITYIQLAESNAASVKVQKEQEKPSNVVNQTLGEPLLSAKPLNDTWKDRFEVLEKYEKGGVKLTFKDNQVINFNLAAFLFGPIYYFIKGMWIKGAYLLGALFVFYGFISLAAESGGKLSTGAFLGPNFLIMTFANKDYYRHVKYGDKIWRWMPKWCKSPFSVVPTILSTGLLWFVLSYNFDFLTLDDMSGVWLADSDRAMVIVDLVSANKSITINEKRFPIRQVFVDSNDSSIVSIEVEWLQGQIPIWTLSKLENEDGTFYLDLTLHNGARDELSFVRSLQI
ncbi:DUF2628 domain-containing protein [Shewanella halifaxensis]|uniref:DUF2628 domain-containing protein n=1 Tax=Shewanella halifaxensis TaxID=271098 RepID=UPI0013A66530|nr:DUF2628 domain-containing protein [Shewanella halifaxensis]